MKLPQNPCPLRRGFFVARSDGPASTTAYTQRYQYDKLGNIQQLRHTAANSADSFTRTFDYGSGATNYLQNVQLGTAQVVYQYDAAGNVTQENGSRHYQWDAADQLRQFATWTGPGTAPTLVAYYVYAGGQRVKKLTQTSADTWQVTVYAAGGFEYRYEVSNGTLAGEQTQVAVLDGPRRLYQRRTGDALGDQRPASLYALDDHLGSAAALTDAGGQLVSRQEYYPFGETSFGSTAKQRYQFCSKELDEESGLYYYGMRYYAPWLCRFISVDPLAEKYPYYTPYQYAGNKPIISIDIDGLEGSNDTGQQATAAPTAAKENNQLGEVVVTGYRDPPVHTAAKSGTSNTLKASLAVSVLGAAVATAPEAVAVAASIGPVGWVLIGVAVVGLLALSAYLDYRDDQAKLKEPKAPRPKIPHKQRLEWAKPALQELKDFDEIMQDPLIMAPNSTTDKRAKDPNYRWVTYTRQSRTDPTLFYSGRTGGPSDWTIDEILAARYQSKDERAGDFYDPVLDKQALGPEGYLAIRGREQQLIDLHGGAKSDRRNFGPTGGTSANSIRGVDYANAFGKIFHTFSNFKFQEELYRFTGRE